MCGFISYLGKDIQEQSSSFQIMLDAIRHRGPDDKREVYFDEYSYFGHVRLAIIDQENSTQPMVSDCGRYIMVFNGEIYNFVELRQRLIQYGINFKTYGDTEVLLKLLILEGEKCLKDLNGMFSFVFYDQETSKWIAARDHFGIKPLYYSQLKNGSIVFASEIKAILLLRQIQANCDFNALYDYLRFQICLDQKTLFKNILKVLPATYLKGNLNNPFKLEKEEWWKLKFAVDFEHNQNWYTDRLSAIILDSIQLQTRSDVAIGSYLSGGIDSSLIASLSANYLGIKLPCFHGKFANYPEFDESKYALEVARNANIEYNEIIPSPQEFIDDLPKIIRSLDEPLAGPGVFPQYLVSKLASQKVKVVLGGQGGDELFCGYSRYLIAYLEQALKGSIQETQEDLNHIVTLESIIPNLPSLKNYFPLIKKFWSKGLFGPMNKRYFHIISRIESFEKNFDKELLNLFDEKSQFNRFDQIFERTESDSYINKMTFFDLKTLLPALLHVEDRVSMAWGIEARVPLLDYRIAELLANIPPKLKFEGGRTKSLLKKFSQSFLPESIVNRSDKMGFPVPISNWIKDEYIKEFIGDTLLSSRSLQRGIYKKKFLNDLVNCDKEPAARDLWGALSLELWHQEFID